MGAGDGAAKLFDGSWLLRDSFGILGDGSGFCGMGPLDPRSSIFGVSGVIGDAFLASGDDHAVALCASTGRTHGDQRGTCDSFSTGECETAPSDPEGLSQNGIGQELCRAGATTIGGSG